jgi:outer membrane protein assembly factor BamE (lipoprotein component of BamABCDE complex)
MKNSIYILSTLFLVSLASCTSSNITINEFTTTGEIYNLKIGMSEAEVITTLGIQPYEIQYNFEDQSKVLLWNYRRPHHEVNRETKNTASVLNIQNPKWKDEEILHVHIDNGKISNFYTKTGRSNSNGLMNKKFDLIK